MILINFINIKIIKKYKKIINKKKNKLLYLSFSI